MNYTTIEQSKKLVEHPSFEKEYYSFNASDSELYHWEYKIPDGFKAKIEDGKIIIDKIK